MIHFFLFGTFFFKFLKWINKKYIDDNSIKWHKRQKEILDIGCEERKKSQAKRIFLGEISRKKSIPRALYLIDCVFKHFLSFY